MKKDLFNKEYRHAFVEESVKTGIAFQARALRLSKGWSQKELGEKAGKPQNVISRLEDPDYGSFTIRTLLDLASAFDVALLVRFVSFGQLLHQLRDVSPKALAVPDFEKEQAMYRVALESSAIGQAAIGGLTKSDTGCPTPEEMIFGRAYRSRFRALMLPTGQPKATDKRFAFEETH